MITTINVFRLFPIPLYKTNIEREFTKQEQDEFDAIVSKDLEMTSIEGYDTSKWKGISTDK